MTDADPGALSDAALVRRVLDGEADAFAPLVARYHGRCVRYADRMLGNRADAEDAVQDAFVRAYDALGRYEERYRFASWLFCILANECRSAADRRGRRERWVAADEAAVLGATASGSPAAAVEDEGRREAVERALAGLEPLLREAFLLRHVEELSYAEMQAVTGAGASALKMRVKRACDALRLRLEGVRDA
jgi:RNA polymerase sigma-70 factor, ECF subfamily